MPPTEKQILEALRTSYGVTARSIESLPFGLGGHSYRVRRGNGVDLHLKCVPSEQQELQIPLRDGFHLPLLGRLSQVGIRAPRVIQARDRAPFASDGRGTLLVLSEWIDGTPVNPLGRLPEGIRLPLARTLGALHASTSKLDLSDAPTERYELPFEAGLRDALARLDTDALPELNELVAPHRARIEAELSTLLRVSDRVAALEAPRVLSHTDVHGGNLILDPQGSLWLLDWDGAQLAPCEQDLAGATNAHVPREEFGAFIDTYLEARAEPVRLQAELFEFYYRRRCLEDLEAFMRELRLGRGEAADRRDLALLRSECLDWLERMQNDVEFVRDALSSGARA